MSCKLQKPDAKTLYDRTSAMFSTTVLGGGTIIPESNEFYAVALNYALQQEFYSTSELYWRERDPRYACCDNLIDIAALDGMYPAPASFAQGYITITGVAGSLMSQGLQITIGTTAYVPASTVPATMPQGGSTVIRVIAVQPGSAGNTLGSTTGTINNPPEGIDAEITVFGQQFCNGAEAETCEQFRSRYLDRMSYTPNFGLEKIKELVLDWPCVTSTCERAGSCCEPSDDPDASATYDCVRPIRLYAIFDGTFPCGLAPQCVVDEMTTAIFGEKQGIGQGQAEWGMLGEIYTATATYINMVIDGVACASPAQATEIENRIRDFASRICPSQLLALEDIKVIIAQIIGGTSQFDVIMTKDDPNDSNVAITLCGDAEPNCDYKVCLKDVEFTNPTTSNGGLCG